MIRDAALDRRARDVDVVAGAGASLLVRRLEAIWGRRGFRFRKRGVTTWRFALEEREVDIVDASRRGIDEDLRRREFTINAIAFDLRNDRIRDPLRGLRDLRKRILRIPRPGIIREDPVRSLRAARFLARLPGFRLEPTARAEILAAARSLRRESVERIRDELDALLMAGTPQVGLLAIEEWGLLGPLLPELVPLLTCVAGEGRPNVWRHTVDALALSAGRRFPGAPLAADPEETRTLRWALLLHDIAKPDTLQIREDGRPAFHGHEVLGARKADLLLKRLRFPRAFRRRVCHLVLLHLRPGHLADAGAPSRGLRRLVHDVGADLRILVAHAACDARASGGAEGPGRWRRLRKVLLELLAQHEAQRRQPLPRLLTGEDVMRACGIPPGPEVGRILRDVRTLQEDGVVSDRATALELVRRRPRPP